MEKLTRAFFDIGIFSKEFGNVKRHMIRYKEAMKYCKNKIVIDWGCWKGYGSFMLSQVAKTVYAFDFRENIEFASKHIYSIPTAKPNLYFRLAGETLPFDDGTIDVVVCCEVIEHLKNPQKILEEFHRVLKKGGILYISTPNATFSKIKDKDWNRHLEEKWKNGSNHFYEFEIDELRNLICVLSGFRVEDIFVQYKPRKGDKRRYIEVLNEYLKSDLIADKIYKFHNLKNVNPDCFQQQIQVARKNEK